MDGEASGGVRSNKLKMPKERQNNLNKTFTLCSNVTFALLDDTQLLSGQKVHRPNPKISHKEYK